MDKKKTGMGIKKWGASLLVAVWWYGYVLYQYLFMTIDAAPFIGSDLLAGTLGALAFILLQFLCEGYIKKPAAVWCLDIMQFIYCLPPLLSLIHYRLYGSLITCEEATAIYNTNWREAGEWLLTYMGPLYATLLGIGMAASILLLHRLRSFLLHHSVPPEQPPQPLLVVSGLLVLCLGAGFFWLQTDFMAPYAKAVRYSMGLSQYYRHMAAKEDRIFIANQRAVSGTPHTIIVVIGESAARDSMKVYNPSQPFANTPWLSQQATKPGFILFTNAYACQSMTQQVLEGALTEKSAYNNKEFLDSVNIIDIAKKKGYKTYWITNLGRNNNESSFFNVAARADSLINTGQNDDHSMLAELTSIDPMENNLIIFHGNGSHAAYKERYPKEMAVFTGNTREVEYANSILYTDDFLRAIYEYAQEKLHLQAMLYFSDHGEDMGTGHTPNDHNFIKVRIPMFIYLGPEYRQNNPAKAQQLLNHQHSFFTNDMLYNTLSGILNAESNFYQMEEDLSSGQYSYNRHNVWTFGHTVKVEEDPYLP